MKNILCARTFVSLFFLAEITLFSCSPLRTAGGSEIGNPTNARVVGTVVYPDGGGSVAGADVRLRPKTFCKDTTLAALSKGAASNANTMTDDKGRFVLDSVDTGNYSIEVNDGKSHAALISCSVSGADTAQTLPVDTARPTSLRSGTIMAAKNGSAVYVQIFGLDRVVRANPGTGQFLVADVPQGSYDLRVLSSSPGSVSFTENNVSVKSGSGASIGVVDLTSFGGWRHSRKLSLNTTATGADIAVNIMQFPLLVRLTKEIFNFGEASADGADIRFAKSDGRFLPYEIERWDPVTEHAEVWVKVDTVYGNNNAQSIMLYWGASASSATAASNSAAVFDTAASKGGFQGVWHMGQAGNTLAKDATINRYNGTPFNMTAASAVTGMIGVAQEFDGASSYIQMSNTSSGKLNFPENGFYSVSAWVNCNTSDFTQFVAGKGHEQYYLKFNLSIGWEFVEWKDNSGPQITSSPPTEIKTWKYLAGVRNGTSQKLFVDGACIDSTIFDFPDTVSRNSQSDFSIGAYLAYVLTTEVNEGYCFFNGKIDEVRVSNNIPSADWIKLCYMNQKTSDALITW